jgi:hypothetical protein
MSETEFLALESDTVKNGVVQAWAEVSKFVEHLPVPTRSPLQKFFPTETCAIPIKASISEYTASHRLLIGRGASNFIWK